MYEIYINDRPLRLIATADLAHYAVPDPSRLLARYSGKVKTLLNYADMLEKGSPKVQSLVLHYPLLEQLWEDFLSHYKIITAAGGIVQLKDTDKRLFIYRRGFLDLPKGKIDPGETPAEAAIREVQEETGLVEVAINHVPDPSRSPTPNSELLTQNSQLPIYPTTHLPNYPATKLPTTNYRLPTTTLHTYRTKKDKRILKPTYWYPMKTNQEELIPQTEEDIEWARWMTIEEALSGDWKMYANLERLLD